MTNPPAGPTRAARWFARALLAVLLVLAAIANGARAAAGGSRVFDIPAGDASRTLKQFTAQAGEQLLYAMDAVRGVSTHAAKGEMIPREALDRMFAETGLKIVQDTQNGALSLVRATDPKHQPKAKRIVRAPNLNRPASDNNAMVDETVELSPFSVNANRDVGYVATSSLAGSRLDTSLRDTAASISVLTSEFISDIGATTLAEVMEWSTNGQIQMGDALTLANTSDDLNSTFSTFDSFRVRGLTATSTRNYFAWEMPVDSYNLERVEEARGPNSILFGIESAGGVVNAATKQATLARDIRRVSAGISSHGGHRGTIDFNQRFGGRLALRLNAVADRTESFRNHIYHDKRFAHLATTFRPAPTTTLRAEYETGRSRRVVGSNQHSTDLYSDWVNAGRPLIASPIPPEQNATNGVGRLGAGVQIYYIGNTGTVMNLANQYRSAGSDFALPPDIVPYEVNTGGPGAMQRPHFDTVTVSLEHQFGQNTFVELAYNHQQYRTKNFQPATDSSRLYVDPNVTLPDGRPNPFVGQFMVEGESWAWDYGLRSDNTRLTLAHDLDLGQWGRYRFAGMGENQWRSYRQKLLVEVWADAPVNDTPENGANVVRRRNYVTPGKWASFYRTTPLETGLIRNLTDPVTGLTLSSTMIPRNSQNLRDNPEHQQSMLLATQARYFGERLVFGVGYRMDRLDIITRGATRDPRTSLLITDYTSNVESAYDGSTRTAGVVYHVTPTLSVFYNNSDNFNLPPNIRLVPDGQRASNPEGRGSDVGFAVNLFDGRFAARATYYQTKLLNGSNSNYGSTANAPQQVGDFILDAVVAQGLLSTDEADTHRVDNTGSTFSQRVEGYELHLTANPTRNWRLQANFSYTDGSTSDVAPEVQTWVAQEMPFLKRFDPTIVTSNAGRTIAQVIADFENYHVEQLGFVGLALSGNRKYKTNVFTSYSFSEGLLRGLSVGGGYRHFSKLPIGRYPDGTLQYGPSYWDSHAMLGYQFTRSPVPWLKHLRVQLNVQNLFNEDEAYVFRRTQDTPEVIRRIRVREPRTWRLATTFDF